MERPERGMRLVAGIAGAAAGLALAAPAHAENPSSYPNVVAPVLATDVKGNNLLVLQRDVNGTAKRGQVVAHFRSVGANTWAGRVNVSTQKRTGDDVAAAMGPGGVGVVAWTAKASDGRRAVFVRVRLASGGWSAQQRVSPFGVREDVDVAMNRYRDIAVGYVYRGHARLATRARGGAWQQAASFDSTYIAPEVDFWGRQAHLTYRVGKDTVEGSPSTLLGTGMSRVSRQLPGGALVRENLVTTPVGSFAYAATSQHPPYLVITTNRLKVDPLNAPCGDDFPDGAEVRLYRPAADPSAEWAQEWAVPNAMWQTKPAVDVVVDRLGAGGTTRAAAKVSWLRGLSGGEVPCSEGPADVRARTSDPGGGGWTPAAQVGDSVFSPETTLAQTLAADGASWVSSGWEDWQGWFRPGSLKDFPATWSENARTERVDAPAVTVGPIGPSVVAWMHGDTLDRPVVRVQRYGR